MYSILLYLFEIFDRFRIIMVYQPREITTNVNKCEIVSGCKCACVYVCVSVRACQISEVIVFVSCFFVKNLI